MTFELLLNFFSILGDSSDIHGFPARHVLKYPRRLEHFWISEPFILIGMSEFFWALRKSRIYWCSFRVSGSGSYLLISTWYVSICLNFTFDCSCECTVKLKWKIMFLFTLSYWCKKKVVTEFIKIPFFTFYNHSSKVQGAIYFPELEETFRAW